MKYLNIKNADANQLAALFLNVFNSSPWNDDWIESNAFERINMQLQNPNSYGIFITDNNEYIAFVLGYISVLPNGFVYCIEDFCVKNEYQGKNIGSLLINKLKEELSLMDIKIIITTTIKSFKTVDFYKKNGFEENNETIWMHCFVNETESK